MRMHRIVAVIDKEFHDALRNRYVVMLTVLLPIVIAAIPIISLTAVQQLPPTPEPSGQPPRRGPVDWPTCRPRPRWRSSWPPSS